MTEPKNTDARKVASDKAQRLAEQLRENLRRRKVQARGQKAEGQGDSNG